MKNIFYATKLDKNKNKLTVGYLTEKNRTRYAKDANYQDTVFTADFNEEGKLGLFDLNQKPNAPGFVMRGMLVNNTEVAESSGNFVLYGKIGGVWRETPFRFSDFSAANSAMKAMISQYQAMLIRDEGDREPLDDEPDVDNSSLTISED